MARIKDREAVAAKVIEMVSNGLTLRRACEWAGVAERTFRKWRSSDGPLETALKKAEIEFEAMHLGRISDASKGDEGDWKASAWLLERKFKKRYAKVSYSYDPKPKEDEADEATVLFRPPTKAEYQKMKAGTEKAVASLKAKRTKPKRDA